jgi:2,5-dihydroxypyridine 5,6-dioxygenase
VHWIAFFEHVFALCGVKPGDACAVLAQTQSRPELPQFCKPALLRMGARPFRMVLPGRVLMAPVPVRSTGASDAIGGLAPVVQALAGASPPNPARCRIGSAAWCRHSLRRVLWTARWCWTAAA